MKKRLTKIWGIGLVVVMLITLLASAAPVSAGTLAFSNQTAVPSTTDKILVATAGMNIVDLAVNGDRIYAAMGAGGGVAAQKLYKSSNGGATWSALTVTGLNAATDVINLVAVAPDNEDIVVVLGGLAGATTNLVAVVSTDGGSNWNSLGTVQSATGTVAASQLHDLAISALSGSVRYVAAAGKSAAGPGAYFFNLGATAPIWENAVITGDFTAGYAAALITEEFFAVAFSPNFASDMVMMVIGDDPVANTPIEMHIASFNQQAWDAAVFAGYPVAVKATSTALATLTLTKADLAVDPEYLGGDDSTRIVFAGLTYVDSVTATEIGDVFRMKDTTVKDLAVDVQINSVAWDGTSLAAGAWLSNNVYRSADALVTTPAVSTSRGNKEIGIDGAGNDMTIVRWAGGILVGGKSSNASAFGTSTDKGKTWNSISLIDSALTNILDFAVSADGSVKYLLAADGGEISLYRSASAWQKVFCIADDGDNDWIVRIAASDSDVVYISDKLEKTMYYTTDAGIFKWTVRASRYNVADMAVQDADVAYVAESGASIKVSKSTNGGFTWGTSVSTKHAGVANHTINLISDDNLLVGSTTGHVAYSTDGNVSWTKVADQLVGRGTPLLTQVTASGLADGDYIYASTSEVNALVERWQIGTDVDWKNLAVANTATLGCYGIALDGSVLYSIYSLVTLGSELNRTNTPESSTPAAAMWTNTAAPGGVAGVAGFEAFVSAPSALRVSSGSAVLWVIDTVAGPPDELWAFTDTLGADLALNLVSPAEGFKNPINPVSGNSQDVAFTWDKPTTGNINYTIRIYTDAAATAQVLTANTGLTASAAPVILCGPNQTVAAQTVAFAAGQTYYWRVRTNAPVLSPWSELRSFTISPLAAQVPTILSPAVGTQEATTRPSFSWAPLAGATNYQFQLALNPYMNAPLVDTNIASTAYRLLTELERGTTYYWRVQSTAPVAGEWSAVSNFLVAELPAEAAPPVVIEQLPAPVINIPPAPAPIMPADIIIPSPVVLPAPIAPVYIWAIIIIGAVLVIAVVVLIVRTRRAV